MEDLTEVITAAEFHPNQCNTFVYSSSKGTIRMCDMRTSALCDNHAKREANSQYKLCALLTRVLLFHFFFNCYIFLHYSCCRTAYYW